jgi:hypothetical protein
MKANLKIYIFHIYYHSIYVLIQYNFNFADYTYSKQTTSVQKRNLIKQAVVFSFFYKGRSTFYLECFDLFFRYMT